MIMTTNLALTHSKREKIAHLGEASPSWKASASGGMLTLWSDHPGVIMTMRLALVHSDREKIAYLGSFPQLEGQRVWGYADPLE